MTFQLLVVEQEHVTCSGRCAALAALRGRAAAAAILSGRRIISGSRSTSGRAGPVYPEQVRGSTLELGPTMSNSSMLGDVVVAAGQGVSERLPDFWVSHGGRESHGPTVRTHS